MAQNPNVLWLKDYPNNHIISWFMRILCQLRLFNNIEKAVPIQGEELVPCNRLHI